MNNQSLFSSANTKKAIPYMMIAPVALLIIFFLFYPIINVFITSLFKYSSLKPNATQFIAFDNFSKAFFEDRHFWNTLKLSGLWVGIQVSIQLFFGLILALILNKKFAGRGIARSLMFLPWSISGVLASVIWIFIYNQNIGLLNDILMKLGIISRKIAWTGNAQFAFLSVVLADFWRATPFMVITLLAGLQTVPEDIYEACDIDGANKWQRLTLVTLPSIKDVIVLATLLTCVWEFKSVDLIFNLTGGGPAHRTMTLSMYITQTAIRNNDFGYGSALGVIAFIILSVFAIVYLKISKFGQDGMKA